MAGIDHKAKIIESVFSRRNAAGNLEEAYISHIKIWEEADSNGRKPRYILLSQAANGSGFIHKSKLNSNGTFSVGKTWRLPELRGISVSSANGFNITLSRTYRWQTEDSDDQRAFIEAMISLFRKVTNGNAPLQIEGLEDQEHGRQRIRNDYICSARTPSPTVLPSSSRSSPYAARITRHDSEEAPPASAALRAPSPAQSSRSIPSRVKDAANRPRPPSPAKSQADSVSFYRLRTASQSSNMRQSNSSTATAVPPPLATPSIHTRSSPKIPADPPPFTLGPAPPQSRSRTASAERPRKVSTRANIHQNGSSDGVARREQNARISFFDPANQAVIDRLIGTGNDAEGEDENSQATMANVEEMIEGYEWASGDMIGRKTGRGAAELIEARLLDELMALEKANIHSFLESDDRIGVVLKYMDDAMTELDNMGSLVSSYKIHLNAVSDDISYIQSQNRGLQVQTQNQRALIAEIENLLQTVQVDQDALLTLNNAQSLDKAQTIQRLEEAAAELYKALQAGQDTDMAATMERLQEYRTHNSQFCKRIFDFLSIMFTAQASILLGDTDGLASAEKRRPTITSHRDFENYLGRYSGLMLYLKEMDEAVYAKLCATYFSASNELHATQARALMSTYMKYVKTLSDEEQDQGFGAALTPTTIKSGGIRRAGTILRSPMDGRKDKDKGDGNLTAAEVLDMILSQIAPTITHENEFITDFLQINESALTFADYMGLDNYFRRQAARSAGVSQSTMKLVRGALDLIFSFLPAELKSWIDAALAKDKMQIFGIVACIERFTSDADERSNFFFIEVLEKQHTRLKGMLDRHINEQIQNVEQTKLTSKKRRGVAPFVKHFPVYIGHVEAQLVGCDDLEIRTYVDGAYENIVQTMFENLKQMAKLDGGEGEDKGQLNYHVILIENMHHFVAETSQMELGTASSFLKKAESIYDENLNAYVKIVLRRPFARIIDYFEGVERLLKTTAPTEVSTNSSYNRHQLKKVVKEYTSKDVRKFIDALFKRVEKHFTEASEKTTTEESSGIAPGTVLVGAWKACEEELLRITELFAKRISQCYPDAGVSLDYTAGDVEAAFRRHRVGS